MHPFYDRYPIMRPYVGDEYAPGDVRSLLLVGESHYLPQESTQHLTPEGWYQGDVSTLSEHERSWIYTTQIINWSRADGFRVRPHSIYRNSFTEINRCGPGHEDYRRVADSIVFCNYFLRPAVTGDSLCVCEDDARVAKEVLDRIFAEYRPGAIIFLSMLAYRSWRARTADLSTIPHVAIPHPGSHHWNRVSVSYGNRSGRQVLGDFVRELWQPRGPDEASAAAV